MRFTSDHQSRINEVFNRFAGRAVEMNERRQDNRLYAAPKAGQTVIAEMEKAARDNGWSLRLSFPGAVHTRDMRSDRINVSLARDAGGQWRIGNSFYAG